MAKRFNNLDAALKYLRAPGSASGTTPVSAPAGSQLAEYQEFKSQKKIITYTRDASSNPDKLEDAIIKPFGLPAADTKEFIVDYSSRAKTNLPNTGLDATALGHVATSTEAARVYGFSPARATVTVIATGAGTATASKITGRTYKKKDNKTYTYPLGRTTGNPSYSEQKAAVTSAVSTGSTNRGVSFKPEIYR
jgi:hypothetical protein